MLFDLLSLFWAFADDGNRKQANCCSPDSNINCCYFFVICKDMRLTLRGAVELAKIIHRWTLSALNAVQIKEVPKKVDCRSNKISSTSVAYDVVLSIAEVDQQGFCHRLPKPCDAVRPKNRHPPTDRAPLIEIAASE